MSPTGLKWAVDPVADVVTTAGDLLYATAADTVTRLGIGTAGQVLKVNSGATAPEWGAVAAGGMTLINTGGTTLSGASTTISSIPGTYKELVIFIDSPYSSDAYKILIRPNNNSTAADYQQIVARGTGATDNTFVDNSTAGVDTSGYNMRATDVSQMIYAIIPNYASTTAKKVINVFSGFENSTPAKAVCNTTCYFAQNAAITSLVFFNSGSTFSGGTVYVYGVN